MAKTEIVRTPKSTAPAAGGRSSPFALMRSLTEDMDRYFHNMGVNRWPFGLMHATDRHGSTWLPPIEIEERRGKIFVRAELPGLTKDDVKVEIRDDALIIEGERKTTHEEKSDEYYRTERSYGHFVRTIALPETAKLDTANATFSNGVLEVSLDVSAEKRAAGRQLAIDVPDTASR
jgi:HSP20 family protein